MALFPQTTCHRCHRPYSSLRGRCPYCGARKVQPSGRAAVPTSAGQPGTEGYVRAAQNNRMQTIIGLLLLAVVVILVITLVSLGLHGRDGTSAASPPPSSSVSAPPSTSPSATPSPSPSPSPSPTPSITSVKITYLGQEKSDFTMHSGDQIQLKVTFAPSDATVTPTWSIADTSVATVDQTGLVTGVKSGNTTLTVTCGGMSKECIVRVG